MAGRPGRRERIARQNSNDFSKEWEEVEENAAAAREAVGAAVAVLRDLLPRQEEEHIKADTGAMWDNLGRIWARLNAIEEKARRLKNRPPGGHKSFWFE
jgi:hypothetical protein